MYLKYQINNNHYHMQYNLKMHQDMKYIHQLYKFNMNLIHYLYLYQFTINNYSYKINKYSNFHMFNILINIHYKLMFKYQSFHYSHNRNHFNMKYTIRIVQNKQHKTMMKDIINQPSNILNNKTHKQQHYFQVCRQHSYLDLKLLKHNLVMFLI